MTTAASPVSAATAKRRFLPRFSLRVLLLAVTAFAIGFPIWYRWPYEAEEVTWSSFTNVKSANTSQERPYSRRVKTWRRSWGVGPVQHGEERTYFDEVLCERKTWQDGRLHGPFRRYHPSGGSILTEGEYFAGVKDGLWRYRDGGVNETALAEYRHGEIVRVLSRNLCREGWREIRFERWSSDFAIHVNGNRVEDRLARLAANGTISDPEVVEALASTTEVSFIDTPLKYAVDFGYQHNIPIELDPHAVDENQEICDAMAGIPLSAALAIFASEHGLACDFRFGRIWITSAEDLYDWSDPTGVSDIVPPINSSLTSVWEKPARLETDGNPLVDVVEKYWRKLPELRGVDFDASKLRSDEAERSFQVTVTLQNVPFKDVLGIVLYQTRCRCKLEGETLVILPPEQRQ